MKKNFPNENFESNQKMRWWLVAMFGGGADGMRPCICGVAISCGG
jgi:hypothetical protein